MLKHSGATKVNLRMEYDSTQIRVAIEDNGKGFDYGNRPSGFGLNHITSRVDELNGTCEVITREGEGTRILVTIPLTEEGAAT